MKSLSRSRITQLQTECLTRYFVDKGQSVHLEVGLNSGGRLRADVLSLDTKGNITIVEVKSSWPDFASDKKWKKYLDFCNKFYFSIPKHLYDSKHGQFIKEICKEHKIGLIVMGTYNGYDTFAKKVIKKRDKLVALSNVFAIFERGCGSTQVSPDTQLWLFKKLAWRAGISVANCSKHGQVWAEEDYKFEKPMNQQDFLELDMFDQYEYLKRFPNSGFKKTLEDVRMRIRFEKTRLERLAKTNPRRL